MLLFDWFLVEIGVMFALIILGAWRMHAIWFIFGVLWSAFVAVDLGINNLTVTFLTSSGTQIPFNGGFSIELLPILLIGLNIWGIYGLARS